MTTIKGKNIKDCWKEITISDYFQMQDILENKNMNALEKQLKILMLISDITEDDLDQMTIIDSDLYLDVLKFMKEEVKGNVKDEYIIKGKKYKLVKDLKTLSAGQFIDLEHFVKENEDNLKLPEIISTLLLPVQTTKKMLIWKEERIEKYMETDREVTINHIIENMNIEDAMGIMVFFYLLSIVSTWTIQSYLALELNERKKSVLKTLNKKKILNNQEKKVIGLLNDGTGLQPSIK
jgi:hypothetical protein